MLVRPLSLGSSEIFLSVAGLSRTRPTTTFTGFSDSDVRKAYCSYQPRCDRGAHIQTHPNAPGHSCDDVASHCVEVEERPLWKFESEVESKMPAASDLCITFKY
jgi:hypothetical protein